MFKVQRAFTGEWFNATARGRTRRVFSKAMKLLKANQVIEKKPLMNSRFGVAVAALIALVVFGARGARSQILSDILVLKSGEKVEGRITNESEMSVTISGETLTEKTERMITTTSCSWRMRASSSTAPARSSLAQGRTRLRTI